MSAGDWKQLYKAVEEGDLALVKYYSESGINLNYQHPEILMTLLVTALKNNNTEIAIYLFDKGADPNLESYYDQLTPIEAALKFDNKQFLKHLKEARIKINVSTEWYYKIFNFLINK